VYLSSSLSYLSDTVLSPYILFCFSAYSPLACASDIHGGTSNNAETQMDMFEPFRDKNIVRSLVKAAEMMQKKHFEHGGLFDKDAAGNHTTTPWSRAHADEMEALSTDYPCLNLRRVNIDSNGSKQIFAMQSASTNEEINVTLYTDASPGTNAVLAADCSKCSGDDVPQFEACKHVQQAAEFTGIDLSSLVSSQHSTEVWAAQIEAARGVEVEDNFLNLTEIRSDADHNYNVAPFYMKNSGRPKKNSRKRGGGEINMTRKTRAKKKRKKASTSISGHRRSSRIISTKHV